MKQSRSKFLRLLCLAAAGSIVSYSKLLASTIIPETLPSDKTLSPEMAISNDYAIYSLPPIILFHGAKMEECENWANNFRKHFKGYHFFGEK